MICVTSRPNLMSKTSFLPPLMFLLLFATFKAILSVNSPDISTDQSALLALKSHITHDPDNLLTTNWSTSVSICNWIGVTCGSRHHRVTALDFSSKNLTGTIPPHLGNLSFLAWLNMSNNNFHGSLPPELARLYRLKYLNFGNNSLNGEISSWFGYFPRLQSLVLNGNNFTSVIPSTLGNLSKLEQLDLSDSNLKGSIPSSIFNISSLQRLSLGYNNLFGYLSSNMFDYLPRLYYLNLVGCQLSGKIPMSLFKCKELNILHLMDNHLEGTVPSEILNLTSLSVICIRGNNFSGEIPSIIGNITYLETLIFGENKLTGQIPSSICNLSSLELLFLFKNSLDGEIPECIGNMSSSLLHVDLEKNHFHGKIPNIFSEGCRLRSFRINHNQLEGLLPESLSHCKDLMLLDVGNNYLNGTFPNWLGNLDQLQVLILRSNRFYGSVDRLDLTDSFTRLHVMDMSHNNFSGYLPKKFFQNLHAIREWKEKKDKPVYMLDILQVGVLNYVFGLSFTAKGLETEFEKLLTIWMVIDFSNNQFCGEIPVTLGELHSLIVLNLSHNCLTGIIPPSLSDLSELESLDLSSNKLHGRIPMELKNLGFLAVLNLSQNNLTGPIPQGKQFDTFTNDSYIGNKGLCELPLSKNCDINEVTPAKFARDDGGLNWKFSVLMGYGCGLVLGLSMGYIVFTTGKPWWFIRIYERVQQRFTKSSNSLADFFAKQGVNRAGNFVARR